MTDGLNLGSYALEVPPTSERVRYFGKQKYDLRFLPGDTRLPIDIERRAPHIEVTRAYATSESDYQNVCDLLEGTSQFTVQYLLDSTAQPLFGGDTSVQCKARDYDGGGVGWELNYYVFSFIYLEVI